MGDETRAPGIVISGSRRAPGIAHGRRHHAAPGAWPSGGSNDRIGTQGAADEVTTERTSCIAVSSWAPQTSPGESGEEVALSLLGQKFTLPDRGRPDTGSTCDGQQAVPNKQRDHEAMMAGYRQRTSHAPATASTLPLQYGKTLAVTSRAKSASARPGPPGAAGNKAPTKKRSSPRSPRSSPSDAVSSTVDRNLTHLSRSCSTRLDTPASARRGPGRPCCRGTPREGTPLRTAPAPRRRSRLWRGRRRAGRGTAPCGTPAGGGGFPGPAAGWR